MTTPPDLSQVALTFAREILAWDEVCGEHPLYRNSLCGYKDNIYSHFIYGDMRDIMSAVEKWAFRNDHIVLTSCHETSRLAAVVHDEFVWTKGDTLCHALLSACIEANRKMKEGV